MKKELYVIIVCLLSLRLYSQSLSPTIINSAGGTSNANGNQYEWSLGEITLINTFSTPKLIVTQGVLQTKTDTTGVGIKDILHQTPDITAYPNPAQNSISLKATYQVSGKLLYELVDMAGKIILNGEWFVYKGNDQQTIEVSDLPQGSYLLKLMITQEEQAFFKVIKIQKVE